MCSYVIICSYVKETPVVIIYRQICVPQRLIQEKIMELLIPKYLCTTCTYERIFNNLNKLARITKPNVFVELLNKHILIIAVTVYYRCLPLEYF